MTNIDVDGVAPCESSQDYADWTQTAKPTGIPEICGNLWSGIYVDCDSSPDPNQCRVPVNNRSNDIGDPVDLTTGGLEQNATDFDLGYGPLLSG